MACSAKKAVEQELQRAAVRPALAADRSQELPATRALHLDNRGQLDPVQRWAATHSQAAAALAIRLLVGQLDLVLRQAAIRGAARATAAMLEVVILQLLTVLVRAGLRLPHDRLLVMIVLLVVLSLVAL